MLFPTKTAIFEFIDGQRAWFSLKRMCARYGVQQSGYYAWRGRVESARRQQNRVLLDKIHPIFARSRGTYGRPRVHHALTSAGVRVSRRRVARLMRQRECEPVR